MMTERASVAPGHNGLATPGTRFAARGSPRALLGLGVLLERVRRRTHKTMRPRSVTTHPPAERSLLRHGPTESQGSVRQLAWTLVGRRPALSVRGWLARTGRLGGFRASDLRRRGAAGESGQSPGHSPVQRWNARALPRSIRVLTRE